MKSISKILFITIFLLVACGNKEINYNNSQNTKYNNSESQSTKQATNDIKKNDFTIINTFPHDIGAYTQGLIYFNNYIYESTGQYGSSTIRKIDPKTGKVLQQASIPDLYFGEGITILNNKIYLLTWESRLGLVINLETFKIEDTFTINGEGWGLTDDGTNLIMSDGSHLLKIINPKTKAVIKTISVTMNGRPLRLLNELEYIDAKVWANIYGEDRIAIIDLNTGICEDIIDFSPLRKYESDNPIAEVLNGIAYKKSDSTFILTGKNWSNYFTIKIN